MSDSRDERDEAGFERRQERRHPVERACEVRTGAPDRAVVPGLTLNISRTGMLVKFPQCDLWQLLPQVGSQARITIDLPPSESYPPRTLECTGRVVREADSPNDAPILAFEIRRMLVRDRDTDCAAGKQKRARLVQ